MGLVYVFLCCWRGIERGGGGEVVRTEPPLACLYIYSTGVPDLSVQQTTASSSCSHAYPPLPLLPPASHVPDMCSIKYFLVSDDTSVQETVSRNFWLLFFTIKYPYSRILVRCPKYCHRYFFQFNIRQWHCWVMTLRYQCCHWHRSVKTQRCPWRGFSIFFPVALTISWVVTRAEGDILYIER
jgi:hypothetical protein